MTSLALFLLYQQLPPHPPLTGLIDIMAEPFYGIESSVKRHYFL